MKKGFVDRERLTGAVDYRQFLLLMMSGGKDAPGWGSISALARKSGLSRSFLTEVLQRKKQLTSRSLAAVSSALKLNVLDKRLFELLVADESEPVREAFGLKNSDEVQAQLGQARLRIRRQTETSRLRTRIQNELLNLDFFVVYAALGSLAIGANFQMIVKRTKLSRLAIEKSLASMIKENWAKKVGDRYYAIERTIDLDDLGKNQGFINAFAQASAEASKQAAAIAAASDGLIFFTAVPLDESRQNLFRKRLRSAVLDVLDEFQDDEGLVVKKITLGMF